MTPNDNMTLVKKLRDETFISMLECKKALDIAKWNYDDAKEYLYTTYADNVAAKKSDRETANGLLFIKQINSGEIEYIDLRSETDFMLNTDIFHEMGEEILLKNNDKSIVNRYIARIGENLACGPKSSIKGTNLYYYAHGGKNSHTGLYMGVIDCENSMEENLATRLCQQVIECGSKELSVFLDFIRENNELSNEIKINAIYLIKVANLN